ncbi:response regulator transcription factor [Abyssisolibacter fermentans]|uniref:response regulator transcription factor n=1 Tax=Abyssisolibacter fermentans TaxID=1766203 RepID=UPI0008361DED|nr:response regulator transcription factor [Abyssisolibacter fermentans]
MKTLLLVEDDKMLSRGIKFNLQEEGFNVISAYCLKEAQEELNKASIDLIILDVNLPDGNGFDFCEKIRNYYDNPIIFLTACDMESDVVTGFKLGADDYITKPFSLSILRERILAIFRRYRVNEKKEQVVVNKDLSFDFEKMIINNKDKVLTLTPTENKLLKIMFESKGQVMTRRVLLEKLWDNDSNFVDEHALTVNINRLRNKIEEKPSKPKYIKTIYGMGYMWVGEE